MSLRLKRLVIYFAVAILVGFALIWIAKQISPLTDNDYLTILPAVMIAVYVGHAVKNRLVRVEKAEGDA